MLTLLLTSCEPEIDTNFIQYIQVQPVLTTGQILRPKPAIANSMLVLNTIRKIFCRETCQNVRWRHTVPVLPLQRTEGRLFYSHQPQRSQIMVTTIVPSSHWHDEYNKSGEAEWFTAWRFKIGMAKLRGDREVCSILKSVTEWPLSGICSKVIEYTKCASHLWDFQLITCSRRLEDFLHMRDILLRRLSTTDAVRRQDSVGYSAYKHSCLHTKHPCYLVN